MNKTPLKNKDKPVETPVFPALVEQGIAVSPEFSEKTKREQNFVIICVPTSYLPKVFTAAGLDDLRTTIQSEYQKDPDQFMYVIRGSLGKLSRRGDDITVRFNDKKVTAKSDKPDKEIADGWLGE